MGFDESCKMGLEKPRIKLPRVWNWYERIKQSLHSSVDLFPIDPVLLVGSCPRCSY
jgi:hypothetical protein